MVGETEPTPWELYRSDKQILETLGRIEGQMLTLAVFQQYQQGADRRASELEVKQAATDANAVSSHRDILGKLEASETRMVGKIENQAKRADDLERGARETKARTWLAIGLTILGSLLSLGVGIILRGAGG